MLSMTSCVSGHESSDNDRHEDSRAVGGGSSSPQQKAALVVPGILIGAGITLLGTRHKGLEKPSRCDSAKRPLRLQLEPADDFVRRLDPDFVLWFAKNMSEFANNNTLVKWLAEKPEGERFGAQRVIGDEIEPAFQVARNKGSSCGPYQYQMVEVMMFGLLHPTSR